MYVDPRIGPWAHGEARNGGLPDWVLAKGATRRDDPTYLAEVTTLYGKIVHGIWPFNLDLGGLTLRYSTAAQLFHKFETGGDTYLCFFALPGIDPEFALETRDKSTALSKSLARRVQDGVTYLEAHTLALPQ